MMVASSKCTPISNIRQNMTCSLIRPFPSYIHDFLYSSLQLKYCIKNANDLLWTLKPMTFYKKCASLGLFSIIFVFSNKHYNSYNKYMWKMLWPSSILRQDSNTRPSEHESPPITTRPGLLPNPGECIQNLFWQIEFLIVNRNHSSRSLVKINSFALYLLLPVWKFMCLMRFKKIIFELIPWR